MKFKSTRTNGVKPLFSFAVVADTHINETEDSSTSPFETNRLANPRARHVFRQIEAMSPAPRFAVHLGDIVHPVPELPLYQDAVGCFKAMTDSLSVELHVVPGNHDVGDKRADSVPARSVCDEFLATYRAAFGPDYYSFDVGDCRFVVLNSLLLNSGLPDELKQKRWFETELGDARRRVFVFMHYPPYVYRRDERPNYDSIDPPEREWLLGALSSECVEAVFAGHVHNFWYDRIGAAELYVLPSTAFVRHDYSEFYRVSPGLEFGRGDLERFGYFVVDVLPRGHVAYSIRTMGATAAEGDFPSDDGECFVAHPKSGSIDRVGVELRHPWTEVCQIASTGGIQEFGRKWARNDYPLLAMWEMGLKLAKVPEIDVHEPESNRRMRLHSSMGQEFLLTLLGTPKPDLLAIDLPAVGVTGLELNLTAKRFESQREAIKALRDRFPGQIFYSRIHDSDDARFDGKHFTHFIKAGFSVDELDALNEVLIADLCAGHVDGLCVRLESGQSLLSHAPKLIEFADNRACELVVSLKMAGASIAVARTDDARNLATTAQAMVLSRTSDRVRYIFDTFMDVDRGYFPRHAFIDRRFNPRPCARGFTVLNTVLSAIDDLRVTSTQVGALEFIEFEGDGRAFSLISGKAEELALKIDTSTRALNLDTGKRERVRDSTGHIGFQTLLIGDL